MLASDAGISRRWAALQMGAPSRTHSSRQDRVSAPRMAPHARAEDRMTANTVPVVPAECRGPAPWTACPSRAGKQRRARVAPVGRTSVRPALAGKRRPHGRAKARPTPKSSGRGEHPVPPSEAPSLPPPSLESSPRWISRLARGPGQSRRGRRSHEAGWHRPKVSGLVGLRRSLARVP